MENRFCWQLASPQYQQWTDIADKTLRLRVSIGNELLSTNRWRNSPLALTSTVWRRSALYRGHWYIGTWLDLVLEGMGYFGVRGNFRAARIHEHGEFYCHEKWLVVCSCSTFNRTHYVPISVDKLRTQSVRNGSQCKHMLQNRVTINCQQYVVDIHASSAC